MPNLELSWNLSPDHSPLAEKDVHIWAANLDQPVQRISQLEKLLSSDEMNRARQFKFEKDRNRFIAGRGLLRTVLGSYLNAEPAQLDFTYSPRGKPALKIPSGHGTLHFNVAHSKDLILIALARACAVGVDVEWIHPISDIEDIATRFFTNREAGELTALPHDERMTAFFSLWTRKEAYLKATGDGISEMLKDVEISFLPEKPAQVLAISGNAQAAERWTLLNLAPASGFAAALAAEAKDLCFSCRQWPPGALTEIM
jgi:4'-phosphopantetheinyl transferase